MATRNGVGTRGPRGALTYAWSGLLNGDVGSAANGAESFAGSTGVTLQVTGTLGVGGMVTLEASLDGGANWFSTGFTMNALGLGQQYYAAPLFRPHVTAGDGTTNLAVSMYLVAMNRG